MSFEKIKAFFKSENGRWFVQGIYIYLGFIVCLCLISILISMNWYPDKPFTERLTDLPQSLLIWSVVGLLLTGPSILYGWWMIDKDTHRKWKLRYVGFLICWVIGTITVWSIGFDEPEPKEEKSRFNFSISFGDGD